jgi:hypothetical protein
VIVLYLSPMSRKQQTWSDRHPNFGVIVTPDSDRSVVTGIPWCADNGCFARGESFSLERYLRWLGRPPGPLDTCLFAVAPDVLGDANATWARSVPVLEQIRQLGYQAALVAQDGFSPEAVDWTAFDVLFIGGTTAWKRSPAGGWAAIDEGKRRGKWVHVGRVNGGPRLRGFAAAGVDSADGTTLKYGPDTYWPRINGWLAGLSEQPPMQQMWESAS